jgi:hypothetical protein
LTSKKHKKKLQKKKREKKNEKAKTKKQEKHKNEYKQTTEMNENECKSKYLDTRLIRIPALSL